MAHGKSTKKKVVFGSDGQSEPVRQSPLADDRFPQELNFLTAYGDSRRPAGLKAFPQAVVRFLFGSGGDKLKRLLGQKAAGVPAVLKIAEKFVAERGIHQLRTDLEEL